MILYLSNWYRKNLLIHGNKMITNNKSFHSLKLMYIHKKINLRTRKTLKFEILLFYTVLHSGEKSLGYVVKILQTITVRPCYLYIKKSTLENGTRATWELYSDFTFFLIFFLYLVLNLRHLWRVSLFEQRNKCHTVIYVKCYPQIFVDHILICLLCLLFLFLT